MFPQLTQLTFKLNNGREIPAVGLGTWHSKPDDARNAVQTALSAGYRHIDTAQAYGNETAVGDAVMLSGVPRESLFLTTKINNMNHKHVAESMEESLLKLHTDYVDLVLMHWPVCIDPAGEKQTLVYKDWKFTDTWREMEKLVECGKARSIGVANFGFGNLEILLSSARIIPAVCQLELHPGSPSTKLVDSCKSMGIHVTAYCCLGSSNSPLAEDKTVKAIADAHDSRIKSNFDLNGLDLTDYEMTLLNSLPDRFKVCKEWLPEKVFSSDEHGRNFYDGDKLFE